MAHLPFALIQRLAFLVYVAACGEPRSNAGEFQLVASENLAGRRVRLVDDDLQTLEVLGELLSAEDAQVTAAQSAFAALEVAKQGDFDLVVSDIGMPGMDGFELIARLRKMPHAAR